MSTLGWLFIYVMDVVAVAVAVDIFSKHTFNWFFVRSSHQVHVDTLHRYITDYRCEMENAPFLPSYFILAMPKPSYSFHVMVSILETYLDSLCHSPIHF